MASLGMGDSSYALTVDQIGKTVTTKSPGNYGLGHLNGEGTFIVQYVGRSDGDLAAELKARASSAFERFKFSYATSAKAAFEKECQNFHDFGGSAKLSNELHPARPADTSWRCPSCNTFG